jgi:hypothetical protein
MLGSAFPVRYQLDPRYDLAFQRVVINWLMVEVMTAAFIEANPILQQIVGWRNRECYEAVKAYDWTARMYDDMNGPGAIV